MDLSAHRMPSLVTRHPAVEATVLTFMEWMPTTTRILVEHMLLVCTASIIRNQQIKTDQLKTAFLPVMYGSNADNFVVMRTKYRIHSKSQNDTETNVWCRSLD